MGKEYFLPLEDKSSLVLINFMKIYDAFGKIYQKIKEPILLIFYGK